MAGIRFKIRAAAAPISDDFNRVDGPLTGSTQVGAKPWVIAGTGTGVPTIASGRLVSTAGSGNKAAMIDTGSANHTIVTTVPTLLSPAAVPSIVFRGVDYNNHWMVTLRQDAATPEYKIARRTSGTATFGEGLGLSTPAPGDVVRITVTGNTAVVNVNGVDAAPYDISGYHATGTHVGFNLNGGDTTTSFDDLFIYI